MKNLPKHVNESRLREFFSEKGEITDAKLMRTKEGKSRQFAFIGFRTESESEEAMKYYNRSFLDTCRITCEIARKVGDPEIPRPWSRHSQKKETKGGEDGKKNKKEKEGVVAKSRSLEPSVKDESGDLQLHEFLEVMQPRAKSKLWANDTLVTPVAEKVGKAKKESEEKSVPVFMEVDKGVKKSDLHNVAKDDAVSDMDYFKSRVKTEWSDSESSGSDDDEEEEEEEEKEKGSQKVDTKEQSKVYEEEAGEEGPSEDANGQVLDENNELSTSKEEEKEEVLESGRLFVRNLPFTATEDELEEVFSKFGDAQVHLVIDKETNRSKGFAYVLYTLPESAERYSFLLQSLHAFSCFHWRYCGNNLMISSMKKFNLRENCNFSSFMSCLES